MVPIVEHGACQFRTGVEIVLPDKLVQFFAGCGILQKGKFYHIHVAKVVKIVFFVPYVGNSATHACSEVTAGFAEYNDASAGHIFATMVAYAFHHGNSARVAHSKTFASTAIDVNFTAGGSIKQGVAGNCVFFGGKSATDWRLYGYVSAT